MKINKKTSEVDSLVFFMDIIILAIHESSTEKLRKFH